MKKVKLKKSMVDVINLYQLKHQKAIEAFGIHVSEMLNEIINTKLAGFAAELEIDLENEDWKYDPKTASFEHVPAKPKMTTVKERNVKERKKNNAGS